MNIFLRSLDSVSRWKTEQKAFFLALLRVWYTDNNAFARQKLRAATTIRIAPLLTVIIRQGIQEGVLTTSFPDQVGEVVLSLAQDQGETLGLLLLSFDPRRDDLRRVESTVAVYTDGLERILGAPEGSLELADTETLKEWFFSPRDNT